MISRTGPIQLVISIILLPLFYSIHFLIFLFNECIRLVVRVIAYIRFGDEVFWDVDGADACYANQPEGQTHNAICVFTVPQGILTPANVSQVYEEIIQSYTDKNGKRVNAKLENIFSSTCGYNCWRRDPNFNVRNQIEQLDANVTYTKEKLEDYFSEKSSNRNPFPDSKPQWELIIVPKYDDQSGNIKSKLILNIHHVYFDGFCSLMMWRNCLCPGAELLIDPMKSRIPLLKNIFMHMITFTYLPFYMIIIMFERNMLTTWIPNPNKISPRTKYFSLSEHPTLTTDLKKIKKWASTVENGVSVSFSNILNTGIWRGLLATFPKDRLVKELRLCEVTAVLPYPDESLVNRVTVFGYAMPTNDKRGASLSEGSRLLRDLKLTRKNAMKGMMGPEILATYYYQKFCARLPGIFSWMWLEGGYHSIGISPMPWAKNKGAVSSSLCAVPVEKVEAIPVHINDIGLTVACVTYGDDVTFAGCGDSDWMSKQELDNFVQNIAREVSKMVEIVNNIEMCGFKMVDLNV